MPPASGSRAPKTLLPSAEETRSVTSAEPPAKAGSRPAPTNFDDRRRDIQGCRAQEGGLMFCGVADILQSSLRGPLAFERVAWHGQEVFHFVSQRLGIVDHVQ